MVKSARPIQETLAVVLAALVLPLCCTAQSYPLLGQETNSPATDISGNVLKIDIGTTALLDRVINFDTLHNTYQAIWWLVLTWKDERAGDLVAASTAAVLSGATTCNRPCDSNGLPSAGCCDRIWLPHIELLNIVEYSQVARYRINANATSGTVTWSTRLVGVWYSPLDFRAYPFDHQHLLMEFAIADSQAPYAGLKWEHVAKLNNTAHTKGADLSGWRVKWGKAKIYDSRTCMTKFFVSSPSYTAALSDPSSALQPATYHSIRVGDRYLANNAGRGTTSPSDCGTYTTVYDEGRALYAPVVFVADVMVKRVAWYYVMTNLLPVLIISIVTFVVYYMPCNALADRMVVEMTLFLSLTALQFVFDFPPANYLNALQQVVLVSYCVMLLACLESLLVNFIATLPQTLSNKRMCFKKYNTLLRRTAGFFSRHFFLRRGSKASSGGGKGCSSSVGGHYGSASVTSVGASVAASFRHHASLRNRAYHPSESSDALLASAPHHPHALQPNCHSRANSFPRGGGSRAGSRAGSLLRVGSTRSAAAANSSLRRSAAATAAAAGGFPAAPLSRFNGTLTRAQARAMEAAEASAATSAAATPVATKRSAWSGSVSSVASDVTNAASVQISVESPTSPRLPSPRLPPPPPLTVALPSDSCDPAAAMAATVVKGHPYPPPQQQLPPPPPFSVQLPECCSSGRGGSGGGAAIAGSFRAGRLAWLGRHLRLWSASVVQAPWRFYMHCKEDPEFAWFLARRIDHWCCAVTFVMYCVVIGTLLWVQTLVGDHKLMLGDKPGNM